MLENELMFSVDKNCQKHKTVIGCKINFIPPFFQKMFCILFYFVSDEKYDWHVMTLLGLIFVSFRVTEVFPNIFLGNPIISDDNQLLWKSHKGQSVNSRRQIKWLAVKFISFWIVQNRSPKSNEVHLPISMAWTQAKLLNWWM